MNSPVNCNYHRHRKIWRHLHGVKHLLWCCVVLRTEFVLICLQSFLWSVYKICCGLLYKVCCDLICEVRCGLVYKLCYGLVYSLLLPYLQRWFCLQGLLRSCPQFVVVLSANCIAVCLHSLLPSIQFPSKIF
jgi:hypothetical protein